MLRYETHIYSLGRQLRVGIRSSAVEEGDWCDDETVEEADWDEETRPQEDSASGRVFLKT